MLKCDTCCDDVGLLGTVFFQEVERQLNTFSGDSLWGSAVNASVKGRDLFGFGLSGADDDNPGRQGAVTPQPVRRFGSLGGRSPRRGCRLMIQCLAAASPLSVDGKFALNAAGNTKTNDVRSSSGAPDCALLECASSAASSRWFRIAPRWRTLVNRRFHLNRSAFVVFLLMIDFSFRMTGRACPVTFFNGCRTNLVSVTRHVGVFMHVLI